MNELEEILYSMIANTEMLVDSATEDNLKVARDTICMILDKMNDIDESGFFKGQEGTIIALKMTLEKCQRIITCQMEVG